MANIYSWDPSNPANNDDVDSAIDWREGQLPSTVNDSARAMMQRVAQFLWDVSGKLKSTGSGNAYAVSTKSVTTTYAEPLVVTFEADKTNTGAATLALDGLTAKPIKSARGQALRPGDIVDGSPIYCVYNAATTSFIAINIPGPPTHFQFSAPNSMSIPHNAETAVGKWNALLETSLDNLYSQLNGTVTIGAKDAGAYHLTATVYPTSGTDSQRVKIFVNSTVVAVSSSTNVIDSTYNAVSVSRIVDLQAGDIAYVAYQHTNSGSAARTLAQEYACHFSGVRLS